MNLALTIKELKALSNKDLLNRYEFAAIHNINDHHELDNLRWEVMNRSKERGLFIDETV